MRLREDGRTLGKTLDKGRFDPIKYAVLARGGTLRIVPREGATL